LSGRRPTAWPPPRPLRAGFTDLEITNIDLNLSVIEGSRTAVIDRLSVDRDRVNPGESVEVTLSQRTAAGEIITRKIPVVIPADAAAGPVTITVADGTAAQQNSPVTHFTPRSVAEFTSTYNRLKRPDRLYVMLARPSAGIVVGVSEMFNLPPSMLATMNSQRNASGVKAVTTTTLSETALPPGPFVVTGSQTVTIEVVR
jgi:hypothetical protein